MARRQCIRSKPKKRPNRYCPNAPDWSAVHGFRHPLSGLGLGGDGPLGTFLGMLAARQMRKRQ